MYTQAHTVYAQGRPVYTQGRSVYVHAGAFTVHPEALGVHPGSPASSFKLQVFVRTSFCQPIPWFHECPPDLVDFEYYIR
mgnify:CR=1 FL=1